MQLPCLLVQWEAAGRLDIPVKVTVTLSLQVIEQNTKKKNPPQGDDRKIGTRRKWLASFTSRPL